MQTAEQFELADDFRRRVILQHMRNYAFMKMQERGIAQIFESSRWSKLQAFVFREWRALQLGLGKARAFRRETLLSEALLTLRYACQQARRERELGKVCQNHLMARMKRKIMLAWNKHAKATQVERYARADKMAYMRQFRLSRVIKAWFNTIDLLRNEEQVTNHALNTRVFRLKKHYLMAWVAAYRAIALKKKRLRDLK